jgi:hypothetical protein
MDAFISARRLRFAPCSVALVLAACSLAATGAQAQERHDRRGHEAGRPYRTPHMVFDNRYHHGHYYPAPGYAVTALPPGYAIVRFHDRRFFFHGGVWYQPSGPGYVVVRPPAGIIVPVLPPAYSTVLVGGIPYYYANEVYYVTAPGGYTVVNPPAGGEYVEAPPPPQPAPPVPPQQSAPPSQQASSGMWYYCESAKAYYPYVGNCPEPWKQVPASPQQPR